MYLFSFFLDYKYPYCQEIKPVSPKINQSWIFIGRTDAEAKTPKLWPPDEKRQLTGKDPDARKERARGDGGNRGWDGWMASPTQWTRVWANSRRWWKIGKPGGLQSMGSQRVRHDWVTKQQQTYCWTIYNWNFYLLEHRWKLPLNRIYKLLISDVLFYMC